MDLRQITDKDKNIYNKLATHVMQSWEWGEFRQSLKTPLLRYGLYKNGKLVQVFQLTLHKIPLTDKFVGYLPKGPFPDEELAEALTLIGKKNNCAFIKIEPDIEIENYKLKIANSFKPSPKPLFTEYNFVLDLDQSEDTILKNMHPKFRYNIKVAQKHGIVVEERTDNEALEIYLKLYFDTTQRQNYHGHNENYHRQVWKTLQKNNMAKLLIAFYTPPGTTQKIPLNAWMLFIFKDTLYYPYGGSANEYKNVMAPNLTAWEAIKLGKKLGLKKFDLWGALGPEAKEDNPWQGFHSFKKRTGAEWKKYMGSFDLIFNNPVYYLFTFIDRATVLKIFLLKILGKS